ncbi:type IV pilus biogenesis/stability protein PilW [Chitinimonas sp. BJYL2]|uniref:type IV pilus biogenesis/stability protein PilW n=1 Tax=Chitinimonas sp. BJYL2 TaxID=2976696 RepID=UPI0022B3069D|nr:type IV pilus biogenesis/stability protein PilW [Chitinimonas sp. BJYL2]
MKQCLVAVLLFITSLGVMASDEDDRRTEVARIRTELAANYYMRGLHAVALDELKTALSAKSDYAQAHNVQGLVYADLREFESAERSFKRALDINEKDPDINHNFGWFLCNKVNRPADALRYFAAALRNPLYSSPLKSQQQAGLCATKAGDLKAAENYLRLADRAQADNPQTLMGLAELAYLRGEYDNARVLLSRQARIGTPQADALWLNVKTERKLGNLEAAEGFGKELSRRFPNSEETRRLTAGQYD